MGAEAIEQGPIGLAVAENVRLRRAQLRLSQRELAIALSDVGRPRHATVIAKIEAGERRVDVDDLVALAYVLRTSVAALLTPPSDGNADVAVTAAVTLPARQVQTLLTGQAAPEVEKRVLAKIERANAIMIAEWDEDIDLDDSLDELERAVGAVRVSVQRVRESAHGNH